MLGVRYNSHRAPTEISEARRQEIDGLIDEIGNYKGKAAHFTYQEASSAVADAHSKDRRCLFFAANSLSSL